MAGADRVFHWADARIEGETVVLACSAVPSPLAVRYAWADNPAATLYNGAGLPAVPFRTDRWEQRIETLGAEGLTMPFSSLARWQVNAPGKSSARKLPAQGKNGQALALAYDLVGDRAWAAVFRQMRLRLPDRFTAHLRLKGDGQSATVTIRLIDQTGAAYVKHLPGITQNTAWTEVTIDAGEFRYAWGGKPGVAPRRIDRIAVAVSSATPVTGTVWLDELRLLQK
jgi:hypothetical protein